jgi:hypothetical protein
MTNKIAGPYYNFEAGQVLKAAHLNQMQQNIAKAEV